MEREREGEREGEILTDWRGDALRGKGFIEVDAGTSTV